MCLLLLLDNLCWGRSEQHHQGKHRNCFTEPAVPPEEGKNRPLLSLLPPPSNHSLTKWLCLPSGEPVEQSSRRECYEEADAAEYAFQVHHNLRDHAEERRWTAYCRELLLGQLDRWQQDS